MPGTYPMPDRPVTPEQKYAAAQLEKLDALADLVITTNDLLRDLLGASRPAPAAAAGPGGSEASSSAEVPLREPELPPATPPPAKKAAGRKTTTTTKEPAVPGRRRSRTPEE